jgi:hypothetical protein
MAEVFVSEGRQWEGKLMVEVTEENTRLVGRHEVRGLAMGGMGSISFSMVEVQGIEAPVQLMLVPQVV